MLLKAALVLLALTVSVSAQVVRDKNGNPLYHFEKRGDRVYTLDNVGNPHGYARTLPSGTTEYRTNDGDLISRETPR